MMFNRRLFWKVWCAYVVPIMVLYVLAAVLVYSMHRRSQSELLQSGLRQQTNLLRQRITSDNLLRNPSRLKKAIERAASVSNAEFVFVNEFGEILASSFQSVQRPGPVNLSQRPEVRKALRGQAIDHLQSRQRGGEETLHTATPVRSDDGGIQGALYASLTGASSRSTSTHMVGMLWGGGVGLACIFTLISVSIVRLCVHPFRELESRLNRIAQGHFDTAQLYLTESTETERLSQSYNEAIHQINTVTGRLQKEHQELATLVESMNEGVLAVDADERIRQINSAAYRMLPIQSSFPAEGRSVQSIVRHRALQNLVTDVLHRGETRQMDITVYGETEHCFQANGTPLPAESDQPDKRGALVVLNDITNLKQLENVRRDFVANVSHELRTPLTSIKGYIETVIDTALDKPEQAQRFLQTAVDHTDRLDNLINDLLLLARIENVEADTAQTELTRTSLTEICDQVHQSHASLAEEKGIDLTVSCDRALEATINPGLIEQAIGNLVSNALTYGTDGGSVKLVCERRQQEIEIRVEDTGPGIEYTHLPYLFQRFYRVDKARSRQTGGTGLGLAIVKHIAQMHGGSVDVESTPGAGSVFSLHIPS